MKADKIIQENPQILEDVKRFPNLDVKSVENLKKDN